MRLPEMVSLGGDSLAPSGGIYNRYLHHRQDLGLDLDTISALADLCQTYTDQILGIYTEMTTLAGEIHTGLHRGRRLTDAEKTALLGKVTRRSELGQQAEQLYVNAVCRGHDLLGDEQVALAEKILAAESDAAWSAIAQALGRPQVPALS